MSYAHILVAVDLSDSSRVVIDKAIAMARDANSKVSLPIIFGYIKFYLTKLTKPF